MRTTSLALATVFVLLATPFATAQTSSPRLAPHVSVSRRIAPAEAAHRHSSTFYEGALRGEAAWISAYGDYLQDRSQAAFTWEHVESMHYDNELKKTATALTRKRMLADHREQEYQFKRARKESRGREKYERELEAAIAYRLNEFEFNWATGAIYWPTVVAGPRYDHHRQKLAILMNHMVRYGEASNERYQNEVAKVCSDFRKQLREAGDQDHPATHDEYLAMQRFLQGLKYAPMLMAQASTGEHLAQN